MFKKVVVEEKPAAQEQTNQNEAGRETGPTQQKSTGQKNN